MSNTTFRWSATLSWAQNGKPYDWKGSGTTVCPNGRDGLFHAIRAIAAEDGVPEYADIKVTVEHEKPSGGAR